MVQLRHGLALDRKTRRRQVFRQWATLTAHHWPAFRRTDGKPADYVPVSQQLEQLALRTYSPAIPHRPLPSDLLRRSPEGLSRRMVLESRWFWVRGPGQRVLRAVLQKRPLRWDRSRVNRPESRQWRRESRIRWARSRVMPPRYLGPRSHCRRSRRHRLPPSLEPETIRRRRESRSQCWKRLLPQLEPKLSRRLGRERSPRVLRRRRRRSHHPWIRMADSTGSVVSAVGRKIYAPRWRNAQGAGPFFGRVGRMNPLHRRLTGQNSPYR